MEQGNRLDSTRMSAAQDVRDDTSPDRRLDAAVAALLTTPSVSAAALEPDPILAAIAETRRLCAAWTAALDLPQPVKSIDPHPEVEIAARAFHAHVDDVLLKTVPSTAAGCGALACYAVEVSTTMGFVLDDSGTNDQNARILDLIARSLSAGPIIPSTSDLATACVEQVKRLDWWDENPGVFSEKQGDEEMERWVAVFRRAIHEPSNSLRDLAGKAYLMLADLDRFEPEEADDKDNDRLMRVIMREALPWAALPTQIPHSVPARTRP